MKKLFYVYVRLNGVTRITYGDNKTTQKGRTGEAARCEVTPNRQSALIGD